MRHIADEFGKEIIYQPKQLLGLISDLAPEHANERRKLKLLFDAGIVDIVNENGMGAIDRVIQIANKELGFDEVETKELLHYLEVFYGEE